MTDTPVSIWEWQAGMLRAAEIAQQVAADHGVHLFDSNPPVYAFLQDLLKAIRTEANTSAAEQGAGDGWRPIESAPKDGTEILGARVEHGKWIWFGSSIWDLLEAQWSHDHDEPPTHWRPLPPSPEPTEAALKGDER